MSKKIVSLTLFSVFLLSAMVLPSSAQPRIVGVNVGDWVKYGDITVSWSSNDPNATFPPPHYEVLEGMNITEWMLMSIVDVSGTNITFEMTTHLKNGTEGPSGGYVDIDTGDSENVTGMVISANLDVNDTVYTSGDLSTWRINETIVRTYPDEVRNTNHVNMTFEHSYTLNETQYYFWLSINFYWDRSTGILVEESFEQISQTGEYLTTWSFLLRITESSVWVVPEFSTLTSILLVFIVVTTVIGIYKRRILKALIY